jgi:hypothetical protein
MATTPPMRRVVAAAIGFTICLHAPAVLASGEEVPPEATDPTATAEIAAPDAAAPTAEAAELPPVDAIPTNLPEVAQASFTTEISEREPVDNVTFVESDLEKIFFFTDLRNLKGQTVTHQWEHNGDVVANVPFDVRGNRWRVWSSKSLKLDLIGEWKASVLTEDGVVIETRTFTLTESPAAPTLAEP